MVYYLSMIPFFDKLQKKIDELKVVVTEKDNIVSTTRSDLVKLNSQKNLLELKVDSLQEKLKVEASKLRDVQADKERLELRFTDASNNLQTLREEVGALRSEVSSKKAIEEEFKAKEEELRAKAKDDELKIKELEEKVAQYESGSTVNQNIIDAVMSQFFSSDEWLGAQIDNFITSARDVRDTLLRRHPKIADKLECIRYRVDRLTTAEKQQLCEANKEIPPTPEAPSDSEDDEEEESGVKEIPEPGAHVNEADQSKKEEDKTGQASGDFIEVTTDEIFAGCGSIEKV